MFRECLLDACQILRERDYHFDGDVGVDAADQKAGKLPQSGLSEPGRELDQAQPGHCEQD